MLRGPDPPPPHPSGSPLIRRRGKQQYSVTDEICNLIWSNHRYSCQLKHQGHALNPTVRCGSFVDFCSEIGSDIFHQVRELYASSVLRAFSLSRNNY